MKLKRGDSGWVVNGKKHGPHTLTYYHEPKPSWIERYYDFGVMSGLSKEYFEGRGLRKLDFYGKNLILRSTFRQDKSTLSITMRNKIRDGIQIRSGIAYNSR